MLTERAEAGVLQWECRVGHRYSPDTLIDALAESVEGAAGTTLRRVSDTDEDDRIAEEEGTA